MLYGAFNALIGQVRAEEKRKYITLYGFNGSALINEITKVWRTSRITNNIFSNYNSVSVTFHKFFLIDVIYTLEYIVNQKYTSISRNQLNKAITCLKELTDLRTVFEDTHVHKSLIDRSKLNDFKITPNQWQSEYLDIYSDRVQRYKLKGHLLAAEPGSGKTIGSLLLMRCLGVKTEIVIAPRQAIIEVWKKTCDTIYKTPQRTWYSIGDMPLHGNYDRYVLHSEFLGKFLDFLNSIPINHFGDMGLILDESHNFNDIKSDRTNNLIQLVNGKGIKHNLWMSGTPLKAFGKECVPLMTCIDPLFDNDCKDRFIGVFGNASDRALDILQHRIGIVSHKVKSDKSVLGDINLYEYTAKIKIPNGDEYTISSVRKKMTAFVEERTKFYKANMETFIADFKEAIDYYSASISNDVGKKERLKTYLRYVEMIRKGFDPVLMKDEALYCNNFERKEIIPNLPSDLKKTFKKAKSVYKYVKLTIMGEALGSVLGKLRSKCNMEIANALSSMKVESKNGAPEIGEVSILDLINSANKKTLLFTSYVEVITSLKQSLEKLKYKPVVVYGATNNELPKIVKEFTEKDDVNPMIATFQSLSTAVPITTASTVIMLNSPFREYEYRQAYARAYRKDQDSDVTVITIVLDTGKEENVSTRSKEIADDTAAIVAKIMGYEKVDLDSLGIEDFSFEQCETCSGSVYSSVNTGNVSGQSDAFLKNVNNQNDNGHPNREYKSSIGTIDEDGRDPYYKTDVGPSEKDLLTDLAEITQDEEHWEEASANTMLHDIIGTSDRLSSYNTQVGKMHNW